MNVLFICKASSSVGLGHLIRSKSLATTFFNSNRANTLHFILISHENTEKLISDVPFSYEVVENEDRIIIAQEYDIIFFDMLDVEKDNFVKIKKKGKYIACISPVFNQMQDVDLFFHRTKYINFELYQKPKKFFVGLEYSIIPENCLKINTGRFAENLEMENFPIAISMGGGDAANKTLKILQSIKRCNVPATFWVMLGEGYQHSIDDLFYEIRKDTNHEIILAKTNKSMWHILQNCLLVILSGGITNYEAVYAGLPAITLLENEQQYFLIKELIENKLCLYSGELKDDNLNKMNERIENIYSNKYELLQIHLNTKKIIDGKGAERIYTICNELIK